MFALIIGINNYAYCQQLRGAVADAKAVKEYLEEDLRVPRDHIRALFDEEATREGIINVFEDLRKDERIGIDDPIVIYYAGHGGELPAPPSWGPWGSESKIQCLIPQDYTESNIHPIPDRTIGALIERIAKAKGNDNISVILDCCHSASGTRVKSDVYTPRTIRLRSIIRGDLDQDIWGGRAGKIALGFAYHGLLSHVLFAACGERELAYEYQGRGVFTTALLETLRNSTIDDLTYTEVLERIHLTSQNPHCEGFNRHRVIFDVRVPAGRQVRHSVCLRDTGKYVIGAGLAHGISYGAGFTLYSDQKQLLGVNVVDQVAVIEDFQTTVTPSVHLANVSFAKLTRVGNLPLYVTPGGNPSCIFEETLRHISADGDVPTFRLVKDVEEAKLAVGIENDLVDLKVLDRRLKRFGLPELSFSITLNRLIHTLGAAAHYYWYLDLAKEVHHVDVNNGVVVDFYLLEDSEVEYGDDGLPLLVPVEPGFRKSDPDSAVSDVIDFIVDPDAPYGIKITNNTPRDLYLNAFLFNNNNLSIASYYTQPSAVTLDPPLKRNGVFTIGYGPGGTAPFTYSLEEGQAVDVGYLKIFFATRPIDLSDIVQVSPFTRSGIVNEDVRKAKLDLSLHTQPFKSTDTWFTLDIPVVQRRRERYTDI